MEHEENKSDGDFSEILADCQKLWNPKNDIEIGEEKLYQTLRAAVEDFSERSIAALVRLEPKAEAEAQIKAIFRAAVYGDVSLLFGDIFTENDAEVAKQCAQSAFRSLLENEREFNGFIPKGIFIDTPLALLSELPEQGFDFFCLDEKRLTSLFTGGIDAQEKEASRLWKCIAEKNLKKISKKVLTNPKNMV